MKKFEEFISNDTINWLLEEDNPSVKYYTLIDLLGKPFDDIDVTTAQEQITKTGVVQKILSKQEPDGYWGVQDDFYVRSKYKGTVWNLIILAELGADGKDSRIKKTCEFIFKKSQDPTSGGFAYTSTRLNGGAPGKVLPCLTGNMVWSLIRLGYLNDTRVQKGIQWLTKYQRFDDGEQDLPKDWPYKAHKACFSKHSCHMGVVKTLKALAEIPSNKRTSDVKNTINQAVEYLLIHHIYKRSHDLSKKSKPSWLRLGFPLMYQTDILEILDILTRLDVKDERMQDAIDIIVSKQNNQGRWILENTFNGRFITNIETKGKPSKWITLNAVRVLKKYNG
ncbi:MAG: nitrogen fixation protein NifH [Candidatus Hodarchaeota archaeon]